MSDSSADTALLPSPRDALNRFFHSVEVPYGMALVRIVCPWGLLCAHFLRWRWTRELYSLDGASTPLWNAYRRPDMLPEPSGEMAVALHTLMIFAMIAASAGWCTRISLVLSAVLFTYINLLDCVGTIAKYTCIGTHVLLILSLSNCGDVWSVDAWRKRRNAASLPAEPPAKSMWARRLLQIFLGVVYFGAAITKIKTPAFVSGDQLVSWMITHVNFEQSPGEWLAMHPALMIMTAYFMIVWEVAFLFVCWRGWNRVIFLAVGVGFHIMTFVMLGLFVFPTVVLSIYFAFLDEKHYRALIARAVAFLDRRPGLKSALASIPSLVLWPRRLRVPAVAAFAIAGSLATVGGLAIEHAIDPYGIRRPEGPHELQPLDPEYVADLLKPAPPLQDKDIFFSFDVGTILVGGALLNQRTTFRPGEVLTAQCAAVPPHEDMFIECNLHDANDRVIDRSASILPREVNRGTFRYKLTNALEPGNYYVVLRKSGHEITRRQFTLLPDGRRLRSAAPVAN